MKTIALLVSMILLTGSIYAIDLTSNLQQLAEDSAKEYVRPFVTAFGTNLNTGLYNTADVLKPTTLRPVRVGVNFNIMMALVPSSDKEFDFEWSPDGIDDPNAPYKGTTATVFGDKGWSWTDPDGNAHQIFPGGFNFSLVPLIVPQLRVGLPKGNELMVRYLPPLEMNSDIGEISFWGVGLKHSIDQYIPLFPVHLAVQGAYQSFSVEDILSVNSIAVNAHVSKRLLMLTLYGGLGWEDTTLEADYEYTNPVTDESSNVEFDIKGDNQFRMTAGVRWAIVPFIHVNADYSLSKYHAINFGLGAQF